MKIINFFIKRSFIVNMISIFICIVGLISAFSIKRDLIPSFEFKIINITAYLPGASAIDMEKHVTYPIEDVLKNIAGIKELTSTTSNSTTNIILKFNADHENIEETVELINSRIDAIKNDLPNEIEKISVRRIKVDSVPFLDLSITGVNEQDPKDREWVTTIIDRIGEIKGIVETESSLKQLQLHINFKEQKLKEHSISIPAIRAKVLEALSFAPVATIKSSGKNISVELNKKSETLQDVAGIPIIVNKSGNSVHLYDLAEIKYDFPDEDYYSLLNGKKHVSLSVSKDMDSDAIILRDRIIEKLNELKIKLPKHLNIELTGDGPYFIERQLNVLISNGVTGFIIVFLVLYFFLGFRISIMTAWGLPVSYFGTFFILQQFGIAIDLISVVGMILVVGILVDDAIIVSEQYVQNLTEGMIPSKAALKAATSTIIPVTGTVLTTMVAFAPILLIKSEFSTIFYAIPIVIIASLGFSWFECYFMLPNHLQHFVKSKSKRTESKFYLRLQQIYKRLLYKSLKWRYIVVLALFIFTGFSIYWSFSHIEKEYGLSIGQQSLKISVVLKESSSFEQTEKELINIHNFLDKVDKNKLTHYTTEIGQLYVNNKQKFGPQYAQINLFLNEKVAKPTVLTDQMRKYFSKKIPKLKSSSFQELSLEAVTKGDKEQESIIPIYVSGGDKVSFDEMQLEIQTVLKSVKNVKSIYFDDERMQDSWQLEINDELLARYGLTSYSVASQLRSYLKPQEITQVRMNGENISLYTSMGKQREFTLDEVKRIPIFSPMETTIPSSYLGNWVKERTLTNINHEDLLRKFEIDVKFDKETIKRESIVKSLQEAIKPIENKYPSFTFFVEEISKREKESKAWMIKMALLCLGSILLILALCLGSILQPFLVAFAIPFGLIGIIWALYFHGLPLGLMAIIGLIGMAGVVVNDSLVMVDFINQIKKEKLSNFREAIVEGAGNRLRPILLTTITTLGGVFPMAYGIGGESGFTQPLAFSLGWGLTFATILTLFVLPSLLEIVNDFEGWINKLRGKTKKFIKRKQIS